MSVFASARACSSALTAIVSWLLSPSGCSASAVSIACDAQQINICLATEGLEQGQHQACSVYACLSGNAHLYNVMGLSGLLLLDAHLMVVRRGLIILKKDGSR